VNKIIASSRVRVWGALPRNFLREPGGYRAVVRVGSRPVSALVPVAV